MSARSVRTLALVVQVGGEPALDRRGLEALPPGVVLDLVALDLSDAEVLRLRTPEVVPAHRRRRQHGVALGESDARVGLRAEQVEQSALLGVIRTRGVARRRTDALILLAHQRRVVERFPRRIAPV